MKNKANPFLSIIKRKFLLVFVLFLFHLFFHFAFLEERLGFNWDQVDNAWAAKRIIVDHNLPLLGMVAKLNSGFHIGSLYYYFVAIFYWLFNLNPIASAVIAGVTSIITFLTLFFVIKSIFSYRVAVMALFIHTFSYFIIYSDRGQWPVNFIVPVSLFVFYSLYKALIDSPKFLLLLGLALGVSFQIHFTSIFYLIIILLTIPFFPRKKVTIVYGIGGIFIFLAFISPIIIAEFVNKVSESANLSSYIGQYYHGFHIRRVIQLIHDAFIEFTLILRINYVEFLAPFFITAFCFFYLRNKVTKIHLILCYLVVLWFLIPWFVFAVYSGEISNYYFFITRPMVILILAYLTSKLFSSSHFFPKFAIICFWLYFLYINIPVFFKEEPSDYAKKVEKTKELITNGAEVKLYENIAESYLYYYYSRHK